MKKTAVLNSHISSAIATLGHYELLTINDAGMPIPNEAFLAKILIPHTNNTPVK